jgi:hypothetical protein
MTDHIDQYCRLVDEGAEVGDPRLLELLEQMTGPEIDALQARLRGEGQALIRDSRPTAPSPNAASASSGQPEPNETGDQTNSKTLTPSVT